MGANYIAIEFESMHWAGAGEWVIVQADSEEQALDIACEYMDNHMRELHSDQDDELTTEQLEDAAYTVVGYEHLGMLDDAGLQRAAEYYGCEVL